LAEFTSLSGAALFNLANMLRPDGSPWPDPPFLEVFFCCIDTAMKTGSANDGSAVVYAGVTEAIRGKLPILWILDWDLLQVGAGKVGPWFEMVWARCRELAGKRTLRIGPAYVEDAAAGAVILETYGATTEALPSQWMAKGKDLRCYAVEGFMNSGRVRITEHAYRKTVQFKELRMNHLWSQLGGFVMGDPEAHKRSDDLLDARVYCASLGDHGSAIVKQGGCERGRPHHRHVGGLADMGDLVQDDAMELASAPDDEAALDRQHLDLTAGRRLVDVEPTPVPVQNDRRQDHQQLGENRRSGFVLRTDVGHQATA
jgi:hypothetical protein